jgi:hypothetical protein
MWSLRRWGGRVCTSTLLDGSSQAPCASALEHLARLDIILRRILPAIPFRTPEPAQSQYPRTPLAVQTTSPSTAQTAVIPTPSGVTCHIAGTAHGPPRLPPRMQALATSMEASHARRGTDALQFGLVLRNRRGHSPHECSLSSERPKGLVIPISLIAQHRASSYLCCCI